MLDRTMPDITNFERSDITPEPLYFLFEKYLIFYRTISDGIEIIHVACGAINLLDILNLASEKLQLMVW